MTSATNIIELPILVAHQASTSIVSGTVLCAPMFSPSYQSSSMLLSGGVAMLASHIRVRPSRRPLIGTNKRRTHSYAATEHGRRSPFTPTTLWKTTRMLPGLEPCAVVGQDNWGPQKKTSVSAVGISKIRMQVNRQTQQWFVAAMSTATI